MKWKFLLKSLASAILASSAVIANAQDAGHPWHLTASENGTEVAFYNVEKITDVEATDQTVTVVLNDGKKFAHSAATTTFGFDPRANGSGTGNKNIFVPQWNAWYDNGILKFSEKVNEVAVYSVKGALVAKFSGSHTAFPLSLNPGIYIVQADSKTAKLLVSSAAVAQPAAAAIKAATYASETQAIATRATGGIKLYLTFKYGNDKIPMEIANVASIKFTADNTLVFTLKNGNTVELANYKGIEFIIQPVQPASKWDWDMMKHCGANYDEDENIHFSAATTDGFVLYNYGTDTVRISKSSINKDAFDNPSKILSGYQITDPVGHVGCQGVIGMNGVGYGVMFHAIRDGILDVMMIISIDRPGFGGSFPISRFDFNNGEFRIKTNIRQNADGSLTVQCVGLNKSCTFY